MTQTKGRLQPPETIRALAAERQLGELCDARIVISPGAIARPGIVLAIPSLAVAIAGLPRTGALGVLGLVGLVGLVIALVILAYAAKTWAAGGDDWYLYSNGIVAVRRRQPQAAAWSDMTSVRRLRMGNRASRKGALFSPMTLRGLRVELRGGRSVELTVSDVLDEGRRLASRFEEGADRGQVPIHG
jgi:hypothetical protein